MELLNKIEASCEVDASQPQTGLIEKFLSLWSKEKDFDENEGKKFFSELEKSEEADIFHTESMSAIFTMAGKATTLGAIRLKSGEIRAFGPQGAPLGDMKHFGIRSPAIEALAPLQADPEVWFKLKAKVLEDECQIQTRFIGQPREKKLFFSFYVKSSYCQIGLETIKPKSLKKIQKEIRSVFFDNFKIEAERPLKAELIPLAETEGFWNAGFMLAFEMHPLEPQIVFSIKSGVAN